MLHALRGGLGADCGGGVVDGVSLALVGGDDAAGEGWRERGLGGGDDKELPRPEIK